MKVEELSQYGKTLSEIPKEAFKKQKQIALREIKAKYGLLGILPFFLKVILNQKVLKKNYPQAYEEKGSKRGHQKGVKSALDSLRPFLPLQLFLLVFAPSASEL